MDRFWDKVDVGDCWEWTAVRSKAGYGMFNLEGRMQYAHRVAYELLVGPIPAGMQLDHLCRNRACVNPDHLEPVTQAENLRRGSVAAVNRARQLATTHCRHGHEYTPENTYVRKDGRRNCGECSRIRSREYQRARRAAA